MLFRQPLERLVRNHLEESRLRVLVGVPGGGRHLVGVDAEQNVLLVLGAVPGPVNGLVLVETRKD